MIRVLYNILKILPKPVLVGFFSFVSIVIYIILPRRRKLAVENIKNAIGGNYRKTAFKTYLYFAKMASDTIKYLGDEEYLKEHVSIKGLENYEYAKSLNRGVLFTTAHFGNWELMVCAFAVKVEPVTIIVRPLDNKALNKLVEQKRTNCGNRLFSSKDSNTFGLIKLLKKNGILGILTDQARRSDKIKIKFFNRDARVAEGIAVFAHKLKVPILPAYMKELDNGYEIVIEKPILSHDADDYKSDIKAIMEDIHKRYEDWIRQEPCKYLWMHNRWK